MEILPEEDLRERPLPEHLYYIQPETGHFYTGKLDGDTQVFMSVGCTGPIAVEFDSAGNYLRTHYRASSPVSAPSDANAIFQAWQEDWITLEGWAAELGVASGVIGVQKFFLPELELGIVDLPTIYQEILDSSEEMDDETQEQIKGWQEENDYVLIWGNEYDMAKDGAINST